MERVVYPGEFYRHFKNKLYQIIAVATHSETKEKMVVYQALYGDFGTYVRPYAMFVSEVDHEKYPEVTQKYRFERVELRDGTMAEVSEREQTKARCPLTRSEEMYAEEMQEEMYAEEMQEEMHAEEMRAKEMQTEETQQEETPSPAFLEFLECDAYEARMECLKRLAVTARQTELDSIYLILDMKPEDGTIAEQTEAIRRFLTMQHHFDGKRLR